MSFPTFDAVLGGLGNKTVDALKATLVESWSALTIEEQSAATHLMFTLAKAHLYELAGFDVSEYIGILQAAFEQWQVVGKQVVVDGIKKVASEAFGFGGAFAGSAIAAFVKSIK